MKKSTIYKIAITVLTFWLLDYFLHFTGVGETHFYYASKFGNAILFAIIWFGIFRYTDNIKKLIYSVIFGSYISIYYLLGAYSGFVQEYLGITAAQTPPPFVIFGIFLTPVLWWVLHIGAFYLGLVFADYFIKEEYKS
jgi:hypothetical protein